MSLQKVDAAELLRLYLNYDLLEEAVDLVSEYVDAVLGKGHQYFGIEVNAYESCGPGIEFSYQVANAFAISPAPPNFRMVARGWSLKCFMYRVLQRQQPRRNGVILINRHFLSVSTVSNSPDGMAPILFY